MKLLTVFFLIFIGTAFCAVIGKFFSTANRFNFNSLHQTSDYGKLKVVYQLSEEPQQSSGSAATLTNSIAIKTLMDNDGRSVYPISLATQTIYENQLQFQIPYNLTG